MRAVLRDIISPDADLDGDLSGLSSLFVQFLAGPADSEGEESFDLTICTPAWLAIQVAESGPVIGRHLLIVESIDLAVVTAFLRRQVEDLDEESWDVLGEKLGRIGGWEFEDYES